MAAMATTLLVTTLALGAGLGSSSVVGMGDLHLEVRAAATLWMRSMLGTGH
jgi:hypothetical protein